MGILKFVRLVCIFGGVGFLLWPIYVMGQVLPETAVLVPMTTAVDVISSDSTKIVFELDTAVFSQSADGSVVVDGLSPVLPVEGSPALPYFVTTLILPPEAQAVVNVMETAVFQQNVATIPPVPRPSFAGMNTVDDGFSPYALLDETGNVSGYAQPSLVRVPDTLYLFCTVLVYPAVPHITCLRGPTFHTPG